MQPFDVLLEETAQPEVELPPELARIHGGGIPFAEHSVYANFVSTLDGVVAIPSLPRSNEVVAGNNDADRFLMGLLRALADVVLVGAGVLAASPRSTWRAEQIFPAAGAAYVELRDRLGLPPAPEIAVLSGRGRIDAAHPVLRGRAVVLTSDRGAGGLPGDVDVVALGAQPLFAGAAIVDALHERGHRRILCEAGPHTFGTLLTDDVVDELFLTSSPLLVGDAGPGSRLHLVEGLDLLPPVSARLASLRRHGDHVFARYVLTGGSG